MVFPDRTAAGLLKNKKPSRTDQGLRRSRTGNMPVPRPGRCLTVLTSVENAATPLRGFQYSRRLYPRQAPWTTIPTPWRFWGFPTDLISGIRVLVPGSAVASGRGRRPRRLSVTLELHVETVQFVVGKNGGIADLQGEIVNLGCVLDHAGNPEGFFHRGAHR